MIRVKKRNGSTVKFDCLKIVNAVNSALRDTDVINDDIASNIADKIQNNIKTKTVSVETIQDMVEEYLMDGKYSDVARSYVRYRYKRELVRKFNKRDENILSLISNSNEELKTENSNKNPVLASTQRDYIAGEVCKDLAKRILLPSDIVEAHENGVLHFHDMDYSPAQHMFNCCLINIGDMLDNGTCINGTMVESPSSFPTACTIMTQIIASVASGQYGGQSVNIKHLGKYLKRSYDKYMDIFENIAMSIGSGHYDYAEPEEYAYKMMLKDLCDGVQTIQYQINTISCTNGQTPFVTLFLELDPNDEYLEYTSLIIKEILQQRIQGVKNEVGAWVTPVFPKLVYVLDEHNNLSGGKYDYLTKLACECTAKRMYPDYISAKKMREHYEDNVFSPMGCVDGEEVITYKYKNELYVESFRRMWDKFACVFDIIIQPNGIDKYINLVDVKIFDTYNGFVECKRLIRNTQEEWVDVNFSNGRRLLVTKDHPFDTINKGVVQAKELNKYDVVPINFTQYSEYTTRCNLDLAWLLGFVLCDGCYQDGKVFGSIALSGEDEIEQKWINTFKTLFSANTKVVVQNRGKKGNYKDLRLIGENDGNINTIINLFTTKFGGVNKKDRQVPTEVFSWGIDEKYAFLGGMMDADGYINPTTHGGSVGQIGSTNKELALQQMMLLQSVNIDAKIYHNHYNKKNPSLIRHRVEFIPNQKLIDNIVCQKKKDNYIPRNATNKNIILTEVSSVDYIINKQYSYDVETTSEHFEVSGIYSHNCRSFLSLYNDENGDYKFEGRFNQGVVTLNLPQIALQTLDKEKMHCYIFERMPTEEQKFEWFKNELDRRLDLCFKALMCRHNSLLGTKSDVSPIHWQHGAIARLKQGEVIDPLLKDGYSTISLGYIGLYEVTKLMTGVSHTQPKGKEFALWLLNYLKDKCDKWKEETGIGFGLYGTPSESLCYRFAKIDKERYGTIEDITDKDYYTNSYHVDVREPIDAFSKLYFESEFQQISSGGCISYIEIPNLQKNIEAIEEVVRHIYYNVQYGEFNTKADYCMDCNYEGELLLDEDNQWYCPSCGNRNTTRMNIVRRTCGYLGSNLWNEGKTNEIKQRVLHLGSD